MERLSITDKRKKEIGLYCANCGSVENLVYHHIVPLSMGGNDILSNMVCLCGNCHDLIHFGYRRNIDHSQATKKGLEIAKLNGKHLGNTKGVKLTTKKSIAAKAKIRELSKDFGGTLDDADVIKATGISRNTYYKYKREMKDKAIRNDKKLIVSAASKAGKAVELILPEAGA